MSSQTPKQRLSEGVRQKLRAKLLPDDRRVDHERHHNDSQICMALTTLYVEAVDLNHLVFSVLLLP